MGFFAGLNEEKYDRQYTDRQLVNRIFDFFRPQTARLVWVSALVVAIAAIGASLPIVVSRMVDLLKDQPSVNSIWLVFFILLAVGVAIWGLNWARRSMVIRAV
ncbi:MAG: hypothetical protein HYR93_07595, partial [Chloroflexi bacterium]|nr:hypothetical protein [Chloroflexota bacterium]